MAKSSTTLKKGESLSDTRGPSKKLPMLNAIEKKFEGGAQEFCEHLLETALTGGIEGSAVPSLLGECLKRIQPPMKPQGVTVEIAIPEGATHSEKAEAIFKAVANGSITLEAGQMMIGMLKDTLQIMESTELVQRLEEIEKKLSGSK